MSKSTLSTKIVVRNLFAAVHELHDLGIAHRDINVQTATMDSDFSVQVQNEKLEEERSVRVIGPEFAIRVWTSVR